MTKTVLWLLSLLLMAFCFSARAAEWKFISQVETVDDQRSSGWINQLVIHPVKPGTLYVATEDAGVLISEDGGSSWSSRWTARRRGLSLDSVDSVSGYRVKCLAIHPTKPGVMYAGMSKLGVFKTSDDGINWIEMNEMLMDTYIRIIAIHPARPDVLYLGTYGGGVYRRGEGSRGWQEITQGMKNTYVTALIMSPENPDVMYAATNGGVSRTDDGGANWKTVNNGLTTGYMLCLAIDPMNTEILYAGSDGRGLFKTENGGSDWSSVGGDIWMTEATPGDTAPVVSVVAVNPVNTAIIYAANSSGVFRSSDSGDNWTQINAGLASIGIKSLTVTASAPVTVYAGTADGKIFAYTEEGE